MLVPNSGGKDRGEGLGGGACAGHPTWSCHSRRTEQSVQAAQHDVGRRLCFSKGICKPVDGPSKKKRDWEDILPGSLMDNFRMGVQLPDKALWDLPC
jgi:hypothetical protein